MRSKTYLPLPARGWPGAHTITYPALWRVRPPFQRPFDAPATVRQLAHVADLPCFGSPHRHESRERHAGQRRCRLHGSKLRPHSVHVFEGMVRLYRTWVRYNEFYVIAVKQFTGRSGGSCFTHNREEGPALGTFPQRRFRPVPVPVPWISGVDHGDPGGAGPAGPAEPVPAVQRSRAPRRAGAITKRPALNARREAGRAPGGGEPGRSLPFCFGTRDNRATDRDDCGWPVPPQAPGIVACEVPAGAVPRSGAAHGAGRKGMGKWRR